jgi:hypothetical protein
MADVQHILRRLERLRGERMTFDSHWQEVADLIIPSREFNQRRSPGEKRNTRIFDTTAILACEQLAGALHGMLTSPAVRWFALRAQDDSLADSDDIKAWFEAATQTMYDAFNSPTAAFSTNSHEMYLDVAAFGTGVLFMADRGRQGVAFRAVPLSECFIGEGESGTIDTLFRSYSMPARNAVALWGEDAVGDGIRDLIEKTPDAPVKIVHAVYPRPDGERATGGDASKRMPFATCYVHVDSKHVIDEGGFRDFPYAVPRWAKRSGEVWGAGPGMAALPDVRMVNAMAETNLMSAQMAMAPPLMAPDDGFLNPIQYAPFSVNYFRAGSPQTDRYQPIMTGARPDIGLDLIDSVRASIKASFYVEWMNLPDGPAMTATEVVQRRDERLRLLGPMVARLQQEFLGPLIARSFRVLFENGLFPPAPPELSGAGFRVEYLSPIALAQRASEAEGAFRLWAAAAQAEQLQPGSSRVVNIGEGLRFLADRFGTPQKLLRSERDVAEAEAAQAEQAAMGIQQAQGLAQVAKDAGAAAQAFRQPEPAAPV